ncbi:polyprenyl synthetase family protein [Nocardia sp. NPDC101769]|uniref:polyprenyl synthetase family protein n=1 Tax=Nocardia sp. NPDC101769 TaxID=3364333 RepID=UPI0037FD7D92
MTMTTLDPHQLTQRAQTVLHRTRQICTPVLRETVDILRDPLRRMAGYHFGWWDEHGNPIAEESGKALRAALTLTTAAACGSTGHIPVPAAAAMELIHNFTLVHDDVMDGDHLRRGRATVWAVWGVGDAILLGDVLHSLAFHTASTNLTPTVAAAATTRLAAASVEMCRGQQQDCAFETRTQVSIDDYLTMAADKTGALIGCATGLGALCAGAGEDTVAAFETFGLHLGLAFQCIDDIIGIWGDPAITGKPTGRDLVRRKRTLPVIAAMNSNTPAGDSLAELYQAPHPMTPAEVTAATDLVVAAGGRHTADEYAHRCITTALTALPADLRTPDLRALAHLVTHRTH